MYILKIGSRGAEVALLQTGLRRAVDSRLRPDGVFGPLTREALIRFQRREGLRPDGVFGPLSEAALAPWLRGYAVHTIRPGDTLWRIAGRYGSTLDALETANPALDPFNLPIGLGLTVPLPFPVIPTDIPWSSALTEYAVDGLTHRYPETVSAEVFGRSAMGLPLWQLTVGEGPRRVLYAGGHHANEWITVPLGMRFLEQLLAAVAGGVGLLDIPAEEIYTRCRILLSPVINPDGVDVVTRARVGGEGWEQAAIIAQAWPGIPFPDGWKANLQGVDLNLQYPALWEEARAIKAAAGFTFPAPANYVGPAPLSAPESFALYRLTRAFDPALVLALHTQGEVIYSGFRGMEPPGSRELGRRLSAVSGYALTQAPEESAYAGYKDWFIQDFQRPGYTVEAGRGRNPLPIGMFDAIYRDCLGIFVLAALG